MATSTLIEIFWDHFLSVVVFLRGLFSRLQTTFVSSQKVFAIWASMGDRVQGIDATWDASTRPESEKVEKKIFNSYFRPYRNWKSREAFFQPGKSTFLTRTRRFLCQSLRGHET
jgi:hypothetical protein